jgi:MFS family permease
MDKFGPRRMLLASLLLTATSMLLSSWMQEAWQLYAFWGVLSGIGTGIVGGVLGATIANRWFYERRGLVTGMFGAATSAGQLIFIRLLASLAQTWGWRNSAVFMAVMALLLVPLALLLMRDAPGDIGLKPLGAPEGTAVASGRPQADRGIMALAVLAPQFWLLAATFFVCGATSNGIIGTHFLAHAADHGIPVDIGANMLAVLGVMNFVGTLASGWLTDRYDPRKLLCVYYAFRGLSLLGLPYVTDSPAGLTFFSILFGLDYIATVPPTIALCADTFGRKNVGTVYGWVFCAHQVGAAVASWLGGYIRQNLGDYAMAFVITGITGLFAAALALMIRRQNLAPATAAAA